MAGSLLYRIWLSGAVSVGGCVFMGNVWNGTQLCHPGDPTSPFLFGVGFGIAKGIGYGCLSWAFPVYAHTRHKNRFAIAQFCSDLNYREICLFGHYQNHLIPDAYTKLRLEKLFPDKDVFIRAFLLKKNIIVSRNDVPKITFDCEPDE